MQYVCKLSITEISKPPYFCVQTVYFIHDLKRQLVAAFFKCEVMLFGHNLHIQIVVLDRLIIIPVFHFLVITCQSLAQPKLKKGGAIIYPFLDKIPLL